MQKLPFYFIIVALLSVVTISTVFRDRLKNFLLPANSLLRNASCTDSDIQEKDGGIYIKGSVSLHSATGEQATASDQCAEAKAVREYKCVASTDRDPYRIGADTVPCPNGCSDGACRKDLVPDPRHASFTFPYPISWTEKDLRFSLTGASWGFIPVPPSPYQLLKPDNKGLYNQGELVYGLTLRLKINNPTDRTICPELLLRRLINEEGDFVASDTRQFMFPSSGGCAIPALSTYEDYQIIFMLPESEKSITITTGGKSNLFFQIKPSEENGLKIEKITSSSSSLTPPPFPSLPPKPVITWETPSQSLTVRRGDFIALQWSYTGESGTSWASFLLAPTTQDPSSRQTASFLISKRSGALQAKVPPGHYELTVSYPATNKIVQVEVTGSPPVASLNKSELMSVNDESAIALPIIADGICRADVMAFIADEYDFALSGKKVTLQSSRPGEDMIFSPTSVTGPDGEIRFVVTSKTPGTSKLTALVDGAVLDKSLLLVVMDPKENKCPDQYGEPGR